MSNPRNSTDCICLTCRASRVENAILKFEAALAQLDAEIAKRTNSAALSTTQHHHDGNPVSETPKAPISLDDSKALLQVLYQLFDGFPAICDWLLNCERNPGETLQGLREKTLGEIAIGRMVISNMEREMKKKAYDDAFAAGPWC